MHYYYVAMYICSWLWTYKTSYVFIYLSFQGLSEKLHRILAVEEEKRGVKSDADTSTQGGYIAIAICF